MGGTYSTNRRFFFGAVNRAEEATLDTKVIAKWLLDMWSVPLCLCRAEWIEVA